MTGNPTPGITKTKGFLSRPMSHSKYTVAHRVMSRYRRRLIDALAEDIHDRCQGVDLTDWECGEIAERYSHRLCEVGHVCSALGTLAQDVTAETEETDGTSPLRVEQIRCSPERLTRRLNRWFRKNSEALVHELKVFPADDEVLCLIVHQQ